MHWIYLIHEFHNLSWITGINELFHDILIYWDAPVCTYIIYILYIYIYIYLSDWSWHTSRTASHPHWTHTNLPTEAIGALRMQYAQYCTRYSHTWITTTHRYGCCLLTLAQHSTPSFPPSYTKLGDLGVNTSLCNGIMDFLTNRPQHVRSGHTCSTTITLNTGVPQGCVLSPFFYSLYTHGCRPVHGSNSIIKFADDTTVIGLIRDNDETAYRRRYSTWPHGALTITCSLTPARQRSLLVDFRRRKEARMTPSPLTGWLLNVSPASKFLGTHSSEDLT